MANFLQITPFMHVADVEATTRFFTDILGFEIHFRQPGYAYIEREGCGIRILEAGEGNPLIPGNRRFRYYVDVRDVDGLYAELKPKLDSLPPEDVHGPANKPYGQRELLVKVPDGDLIAFGQGIFTSKDAQATPRRTGEGQSPEV